MAGIPSTPWAPCPAARPPAGEPRAGKHEADTALNRSLGRQRGIRRGGAACVGTKHRRVGVQPVAHERCRSAVRQAAGTAFHASAQSNAPHAERGHVHAGRSAAAVEREVGRASSRPARPGVRWRSTRGQGSGWAGCLCLGPRFVEENGKLW